MTNKVTLGQLLDLLDKNRDSEDDQIKIMQEGACICTGLTCWEGWKFLENRIVECIAAEEQDVILVWLAKEGTK